MDVLLISSTGGHFRTLINLKPFWKNRQCCWVTQKSYSTKSLLINEKVYWAYGPTNRNLINLFKNLFLAWKVIFREQPKLIVTTGAGESVPFVIIGKLFGSKVIFIESCTRVKDLSLSAKLLLPLINRLYVRWPSLQEKYPEAELISL
ncbi:MAG: UDP-N-acetylglucosamine--LPS N-acetylglucosamine transferase [Hydrococcus sp. SU_1_0]|nr:UDP-N-acetylglucosamine--LPS N-acetylglucosamine transferase [Hydrococcus sp. SU_1_0]